MGLNLGNILGSLLPVAGAAFGGPVGGAIGSAVGGAITAQNQNEQQMNQNIKMWQMNNEYNTPLNQRKRLVEAGYSPALMYGNGTVGNSAGPAAAAALKSTPVMDAGQIAQLSLLKAQKDNIEADTANKVATNPLIAQKEGTEWERSRSLNFDNKFKQLTMDDRIEIQNSEAKIKKAYAGIADKRAELMLDEMSSRIALLQQQKKYSEVQTLIQDYEAQMREYGLSFEDDLKVRAFFALIKRGPEIFKSE